MLFQPAQVVDSFLYGDAGFMNRPEQIVAVHVLAPVLQLAGQVLSCLLREGDGADGLPAASFGGSCIGHCCSPWCVMWISIRNR